MIKGSSRLEALQALRAFAAGLVVFVHALDTFKEKVGGNDFPEIKIGLGSLGVQIFFCISGFIIYQSTKNLPPGLPSVKLFLKRRLVRIAPIYWAATLIYAAKLSAQSVVPPLEQFISSILFLPYRDSNELMRPVLGAGWTLNYEMLFYLVMGGFLLSPAPRRYIFVSVTLATLVAAHLLGWLPPSANSVLDGLSMLSEPYLLYFLSGIAIGLLKEYSDKFKQPKISYSTTIFLVTTITLIYFLFSNNGVIKDPNSFFWTMPFCVLSVFLCATPIAASSGIYSSTKKFLSAAGDGSYSTYLTHGFIMGPIARIIHFSNANISPVWFAVLMTLCCTLAGIAIYKIIEKPTLRKLNLLITSSHPPQNRPQAG